MNPKNQFDWKVVVGLVLLFAGLFIAAYFTSRENFYQFLICMASAFGGFALLLSSMKILSWKWVLTAAIFLRLSLLFCTPELSDDVYRFAWDGRISANGGNPYLYLPSELSEEERSAFQLDQQLFESINSPSYYTVYPPLNQLMFAGASFLANGNIELEIFFLRILIILSEVATILFMVQLLRFFKKPEYLVLLYALNPLVIIELTANLHFEGVEIAFLLGALLLCFRRKYLLSGLLLGAAVSIKLLPLMFLPFILAEMKFKNFLLLGFSALLSFAVFFVPFFSTELFANLWSSIDLYFRYFEFNASFYFLIREVGEWVTGYNIIRTAGPVVAVLVTLAILVFAFQKKLLKGRLLDKVLFALLLYFLFASIVHPWYVILLVAISVFTRWRFPLWWSATVLFSYAFYHENSFQISPMWLWLEYLVLFIALFWEGIAQRKFSTLVQKAG
ncbi:glycosyltransferase 87 family protein [Halocola ammonii]